MTPLKLIQRSVTYYWRQSLGVIAGTAIATAVLTGALCVGDSVRYSLRKVALERLGRTQRAMTTGDRLFTEQLADRTVDTPVLDLAGIATTDGGQRRANGIHVLGVDDRFWSVGKMAPPFNAFSKEDAALGNRLAERLHAKVGDSVTLRVAKPSALSRDIPLGSAADDSVSISVKVRKILDDQHMGRFSLRAEATAPLNAYLPLHLLQREINAVERANVLLSTYNENEVRARARSFEEEFPDIPAAPGQWKIILKFANAWSLADAGLAFRTLEKSDVVELRSDHIFIDPAVVAAAKTAEPNAKPVLTYLVNTLAANGHATPYSIVTGTQTVPDDAIDLTQWLADDLGAKPGDKVTLTYYVLGRGSTLSEESATLTVRDIVPTEGPGGDRDLMPNFPGLADVESTSDWKPGIPLDLKRIRDKDEQYWKTYRGTPKALVSLKWAQQHWGNRFGNATAIRWPYGGRKISILEQAIHDQLEPQALGLFFRPVAAEALAASEQGTDFGGLFFGLSLFLILSAVLLTALLMALGVEQRGPQIGTLLALGFTPGIVRWLVFAEGAALAIVGVAIGLPLGAAYTHALLWGLRTHWQAAAGATDLHFNSVPQTYVLSAGGALVVSWAAMAWVLWRQGRQPVRALMMSRLGTDTETVKPQWWLIALAAAGILGGVAIAWQFRGANGEEAAGAFFGAGSLLLIGMLLFCRAILMCAASPRATRFSMMQLGRRNGGRRRGRSLATISLLACGTFLLVAVNAFRQNPSITEQGPHSGSGGFNLMATTSLPVHQDLNTAAGRDAFGLDEKAMKGVTVVGVRLRDGDEASCLNLNAPQQPPLLGVDPKRFADRFVFAHGSWDAMEQPTAEGTIPAIVDETVATWILHKAVGDTIEYTDEKGKLFKVQIVATLAGSVLQGYIIVHEHDLIAKFPGVSGHRILLIDAPTGRVSDVQQMLERNLSDVGIVTTTTASRLADFAAVQNTYLSIFGVLGGLGLALGCIGLGVLASRNVLERRSELALMRSVGFTSFALRWLVMSEHWWLLALGVLSGVIAAGVAILPAVRSAAEIPVGSIAGALGLVLLSGIVWTAIAARAAMRGRLIDALRSE